MRGVSRTREEKPSNGAEITITLRRTEGGSRGIVDLAHNAHIFERDIPKIEWRDSDGATHTMGEWFEVCKVETSSER